MVTHVRDTVKVTAAIPTIGRTEILGTLLTALSFQTRPIDELILLDEAKSPVTEPYQVHQALDLLSLQGVTVKVLRDRNRKGIGHARRRIVKEASNPAVLMLDDDVVPQPNMLEELLKAAIPEDPAVRPIPWAVPICLLINGALELDGYTDKVVSADSLDVQKWTERYPWFIPYFRYDKKFTRKIRAAGTQAILVDREAFLEATVRIAELGNLPREDTYLTTKMGLGVFTSASMCLHYEHLDQVDRGNWGNSMFYRLHDAIIRDPDAFLEFVKK